MTYKYEVVNTDDLAPGDEVALFTVLRESDRRELEADIAGGDAGMYEFEAWDPNHRFRDVLSPICLRRRAA